MQTHKTSWNANPENIKRKFDLQLHIIILINYRIEARTVL